jgi:prepilin-type N-terminal cleavage/methylation domain-containing protein
MKRNAAGFSFVEILIVMGIIAILASLVVALVPKIQEKARRTKSSDNVHNLVMNMLMDNDAGAVNKWPQANGKNFILWLVAKRKIDWRETRQLEMLFSPGDNNYTLEGVSPGKEKYKEVTIEALKGGSREDFLPLTSYAGRRNKEKEHKIDAEAVSRGTIVVSDDDDGPLHHPDGLIVGYSDGSARFMDWSELDIPAPEDTKNPSGLLGDNSPNKDLQHLSSGN